MIELQNVHKIYVKGRVKVPALRGVNLNVTEQEFLVVQGPSGSGAFPKSSTALPKSARLIHIS